MIEKIISNKKLIFPICMTIILVILIILLGLKLTIFKKETPKIHYQSINNNKEITQTINLDDYFGNWYKSEENQEKYIIIMKTAENSQILLDISNLTTKIIEPIEIEVVNSMGSFETNQISGIINLEKERVYLKIKTSSIKDIPEELIKFEYKNSN